jgi:transposase
MTHDLPLRYTGFVLLPRRRVVKRSFAWTTRFRRLARDFERLPETFRSLHFPAFVILMLQPFVKTIAHVL